MRTALTIASILLATFQAPAQLSTSIIRGHVSDPTGAAVVGDAAKPAAAWFAVYAGGV